MPPADLLFFFHAADVSMNTNLLERPLGDYDFCHAHLTPERQHANIGVWPTQTWGAPFARQARVGTIEDLVTMQIVRFGKYDAIHGDPSPIQTDIKTFPIPDF
jgi:hypothetical protein